MTQLTILGSSLTWQASHRGRSLAHPTCMIAYAQFDFSTLYSSGLSEVYCNPCKFYNTVSWAILYQVTGVEEYVTVVELERYPDLSGSQDILRATIGQLIPGGSQATWSWGAMGNGLPAGYSDPTLLLESSYS